ncbi:MAG TPA: histidine kinase dimerization/phospho-acceptor domain-containing protein, partial [Anaerolineaceae bacterium]|nr:histidine kinase dimerization/phospho-acceptor domain-containing protein [Anaerolineaceae bacterium]
MAGLLNWQALQALVQPIHLGQSGMAWIVDLHSGAILSQNTTGELAGPGSAHALDTALTPTGQEWSGRYATDSGMMVRGRVTPIPGVDWVLVTELPVFETRQIFHLALAGFAIGVVVVGCLAFFNARQMHRLRPAPGNDAFRNRPARPGRVENSPASPEFSLSSARLAENEQRLAYARSQAIQADRLKSELLANVSHELRTPLGIILGFAELLRDGRYGPLSAQQREPLAHIVQSTA